MTRLTEFPDPVEQRDRVIAQIREWQRRYAKKPSRLLEFQLGALQRLVDRLDDMIEAPPGASVLRRRRIIIERRIAFAKDASGGNESSNLAPLLAPDHRAPAGGLQWQRHQPHSAREQQT